MAPGRAASTPPGNLLQMHILRPRNTALEFWVLRLELEQFLKNFILQSFHLTFFSLFVRFLPILLCLFLYLSTFLLVLLIVFVACFLFIHIFTLFPQSIWSTLQRHIYNSNIMTADTYLVLFFRFCSKYFTYRVSFNLIFNNNPLSSLLLLLLLLLSSSLSFPFYRQGS